MKHLKELVEKYRRLYEYPHADKPSFEEYRDAFNECYEAIYDLKPEAVREVIEALRFYADPDTYFAIGFFPDPPNGEFMDDFEETHLGAKPGKRARAALKALEEE